MEKIQADTLALLFTKQLLNQDLTTLFGSIKQDRLAHHITKFAQELSQEFEKNFDNIDLAMFQDKA